MHVSLGVRGCGGFQLIGIVVNICEKNIGHIYRLLDMNKRFISPCRRSRSLFLIGIPSTHI